MNTKTIKFDLNKYKLYEKIKAKQGDTKSRFLLFQLLDGSIPFNLKNRSVRAYMIKPDGREIFNDLIVNNYNLGYCTLELTNQVLAAQGIVKIELMVTEGDKKLTSSVFELEVVKSINSEKSIVSTNEFTALLNGLAALSEYDNYKNSVKEMEINKANKAEVEEKFISVEEKIKNNSEQLDNKANKNEVFTMANMGQDIKEAMTGGSVAVVDINTVTDSNVIEGSVGAECLKGNFTEKSYNEIKIKGIKYSANDLTVSSKDDYIKINGTTTTGGNIKIFFDNPSLKSGNYYIKLDDILCTDTLGYKVAYADGSFTSEAYITNSNVFGLTLEEKTILYLDIYIPAKKTINYNGYIFMVSQDNASKPYARKYISKIITTDNIKELTTNNPFKGKKWVTIGDSITYGYYEVSNGVGGRYQWQEKVAKHFEMTFVNLGISGSTTAGFMRDEVKNNIPSDVDIITVMGGTNDYGQNVNINDVKDYEFSGGTYPGAIRDLIKYLTTNFPNAKILFCNCVGGGASREGITLYEKNEQGKTYYDYGKKCIETTNEMNIPCIDLFAECGINLFNRNKFISDTVHPNIPGYDRIAYVYIDNFNKHKNYLCN